MQLFIDLDGVLVDFDRHYVATVGPLPDRNDPSRDVDWSQINLLDFFDTAPAMVDAFHLFDYTKRYSPFILTGVPTVGYEKAEKAKRAWVKKHFGPYVPVLTTQSKHKSDFCFPGDVLIDDWDKYRPKWLERGGRWVLHTSAEQTIVELKGMGL